jgi:bacteriocin-like protein
MSNGMEEIIMTNAEKAEKIKAPIEDINELSKELSEEELKAVVGGVAKPPRRVSISEDPLKARNEQAR